MNGRDGHGFEEFTHTFLMLLNHKSVRGKAVLLYFLWWLLMAHAYFFISKLTKSHYALHSGIMNMSCRVMHGEGFGAK